MHKNLVSYETEGEIVFSDRRVNTTDTLTSRCIVHRIHSGASNHLTSTDNI